MFVSIAIPCYEMHGKGSVFLDHSMSILAGQTHTGFEVVVSDHSLDDAVSDVCSRWSNAVSVQYLRNDQNRGNGTANLNNCLKHCRGDLIKILCQDDYLNGPSALESTVLNFNPEKRWLVSDYAHTADREHLTWTQHPAMNPQIHLVNSIGTHSCLTVRNDDLQEFDEKLVWLMDCEYYRRLFDRFGPPQFLRQTTVVQHIWDGQVTNTSAAADRLRQAEAEYAAKKHPHPLNKGMLRRTLPRTDIAEDPRSFGFRLRKNLNRYFGRPH